MAISVDFQTISQVLDRSLRSIESLYPSSDQIHYRDLVSLEASIQDVKGASRDVTIEWRGDPVHSIRAEWAEDAHTIRVRIPGGIPVASVVQGTCCVHGDVVVDTRFKRLGGILAHEWTHVRDVSADSSEIKTKEDYFNHPQERRAWVSDIAYQAKYRLVSRKLHGCQCPQPIRTTLSDSEAWSMASSYWTPANRRRALKSIYKQVMDFKDCIQDKALHDIQQSYGIRLESESAYVLN
jgi:hypothetical protein